MNSRENMIRAIEFNSPERIPISLECIDVAFNNRDENLIEARRTGKTNWKDEWGVLYNRPTLSTGGVENKGHPVNSPLTCFENIDDYPDWPNANDMSVYGNRYEEIRSAVLNGEQTGRYVRTSWFGLFERAWMLEGMENFFMNILTNPDRVHRILERVKRFTLDFLENIKPYSGKIHGLYTGDDWGSQQACYLSIEHFRAFFKPLYEEIIEKAHSLNMHVWMHSCGNITEVIQEMIDTRLDVINLQQPLLLGIDTISKRYQGKICFEVPADIQKILPVGMANKEEIERHVRELIEKWGTPEGGIIGMDYGSYDEIGTTEERAEWALNAFRKYQY